jgi:LysM repeat protein
VGPNPALDEGRAGLGLSRGLCYARAVLAFRISRSSRRRWTRVLLAASTAVVTMLPGGSAEAFPYVMKKGETLADIASRFYGRVELERVIVPANALDAQSGNAVVVGMRVEVPAVSYHTIGKGDSWETLAERYLGSKKRGEALAEANDTWPWIPPEPGREVKIPFNLRYVVKRGDSTPSIAYRFLEKRDDAYVLDRYNELHGEPVEPGDVILVPISDLELTDEGRRAAKEGLAYFAAESEGDDRDAQDAASRDLPALEKDVGEGRYIEAIARGNGLLAAGKLTEPEVARIERQLVEAYVAEGADDLAVSACRSWQEKDPDAVIDPVELSPKIVKACTSAVLTSVPLAPPPHLTLPEASDPSARP